MDVTILRETEKLLKLYSTVLKEQVDKDRFYDALLFYTSKNLCGLLEFNDFDDYVQVNQLMSPANLHRLKTIYEIAKSNINTFNILVNPNPEQEDIPEKDLLHQELGIWRIDELWYTESLKSKEVSDDENPEAKYYLTNESFLRFCFEVTDLLNTTFQDTDFTQSLNRTNEIETTPIHQVAEAKNQPTLKKPEYQCLFEAFKEPEKYQWLVNYLVRKDYCNSGNYRWKHSLENLSDLYNILYLQGYLHRKLSQNEKIVISTNTFGVTLSKSTLRKKEGRVFSDIPLASTF